MKTEKVIKKQARQALKGNISKLIAALALVALAYLTVQYLSVIPLYAAGIVDFDSGDITDTGNLWYALVNNLVPVVLLFISPLLNGALKLAADTAVSKDCKASDVFYYFKSAGSYFKTVIFNLLVFGMFMILSSILDPTLWLRLTAEELYTSEPALSLEWAVTLFLSVIAWLIKLVIYMIFVHFQLAGYALDNSKSVLSLSFGRIGFGLKHFGKLFKLMLSFAGWFALCFFILPALYAAPYFAVASMQSARWLFDIENKGVSV